MFKVKQFGEDDFDFSEDFLQDAFEVHSKKEQNCPLPNKQRSIVTAKSFSTLKLKDTTTVSGKTNSEPADDFSGIESLLDDDWNLDDDELCSEIKTRSIGNTAFANLSKEQHSNAVLPNNIGNSFAGDVLKKCHRPEKIGTNLVNFPSTVKTTPVRGASIRPVRNLHDGTENARNETVSRSSAEILSSLTNGHVSFKSNQVFEKQCLNRSVNVRESVSFCPRSPLFSATDNSNVPSRGKRKFPGPAGILPELPADGKIPKTTPVANLCKSPHLDKDQSAVPESVSSQSSQCPFEGNAWQRMKQDFEIDDSNSLSILTRFNIAWILLKAAARELPKRKAPVLIAVLKAIEMEGSRARVIFKDQSGEMVGTMHEKVLEEFGTLIQPGTVLVLRQVSIFSPTSSRHYLNVTPSNIVALYSEENAVNVQGLSGSHLLASAEESLLEATKCLMKVQETSYSRKHSVPKNGPQVASLSPFGTRSDGAPSSRGSFLFRPIVATDEDLLLENDDLDDILQNLDEKDLCS